MKGTATIWCPTCQRHLTLRVLHGQHGEEAVRCPGCHTLWRIEPVRVADGAAGPAWPSSSPLRN